MTFLKETTRRKQIASIDEFYHLSRVSPFPGERELEVAMVERRGRAEAEGTGQTLAPTVGPGVLAGDTESYYYCLQKSV